MITLRVATRCLMASGRCGPAGDLPRTRCAPRRWGEPRRSAFTLVELLVTIIIIGILAAVTLGALQKAQQAADIAKTRALIGKLHTQMMLRYESYRTRRMPVPSTVSKDPLAMAYARMRYLRATQRMELPERWTDVREPPLLLGFTAPAINQAYYARWLAAQQNLENNVGLSPTEANQLLDANQDAECLYMILTMGSEDDVLGAEQLTPSDIGDIDEDGLPEFHDAWGQPIHFLRWAPGFESEMQPKDPNATGDPRMSDTTRHDPFDPMKLQKYNSSTSPKQYGAFALYPLIYSSGIDRQSDIYHGPDGFSYQNTVATNQIGPNDPYATMVLPASDAVKKPIPWLAAIGTAGDVDNDGDEGWADNIHNHLIGLR